MRQFRNWNRIEVFSRLEFVGSRSVRMDGRRGDNVSIAGSYVNFGYNVRLGNNLDRRVTKIEVASLSCKLAVLDFARRDNRYGIWKVAQLGLEVSIGRLALIAVDVDDKKTACPRRNADVGVRMAIPTLGRLFRIGGCVLDSVLHWSAQAVTFLRNSSIVQKQRSFTH